jgi:branched-subunit amino acid aminotransferase/4-amino-4-deoxychorismate lyase
MKAWNKDNESCEHPEPWGKRGVFSTLKVLKKSIVPFRESYLNRLIESAKRQALPWIPEMSDLEQKLGQFSSEMSPDHGLIRICLFEEILGFSSRPAVSDGNPVEGWLLHHRRPDPVIKSTGDKDLYGSIGELKIEKEDWVIIDPKENDLRETATSNLIFASGNELVIPDKCVLNGIILQKILPFLEEHFSVTRAIPKDQEISSFNEIILCGTGRGVAPLTALSELEWSSRGDEIFSKIRPHYEELFRSSSA